MKATIFLGPGAVSVEERPRPTILEPTDAIVRIVVTAVCGSDLWLYRGVSELATGSAIGHEFIGVVEEVGDAVTSVRAGDFIISPFTYSDGTCRNCEAGFQSACVRGGFFGPGVAGIGAQAEHVRVPHADGTLVAVPGSDFSDAKLASLLALTDAMPTGSHAATSGGVQKGDTVAIIGDGAVGLCAIVASRLRGAERIILLASTHENRHQLAREWSADEIITVRGTDAINAVRDLTDGYGADAVLECAGTKDAISTAFDVGRPDLLRAVLADEIDPGKIFDLSIGLEDIAAGYAAMDQREAIKALVRVSEPATAR